jgi:hypothetical protein
LHAAGRFTFRARLDLMVALPLGSEAESCEFQVSTELGKQLVAVTGPAIIQKDGLTVLKVMIDASILSAQCTGIHPWGLSPLRSSMMEVRSRHDACS